MFNEFNAYCIKEIKSDNELEVFFGKVISEFNKDNGTTEGNINNVNYMSFPIVNKVSDLLKLKGEEFEILKSYYHNFIGF